MKAPSALRATEIAMVSMKIDDQRRAGDQPGIRADQTGGDLVAASPGGKQLDHLAVATAMTKTVSAEPDLSKGGDRAVC